MRIGVWPWAIGVAAFNQFSGINAILYYLNQIFADAGFGSTDLQAIAIGLANLVFTYTGPDFRNTGGPYAPLNFDGIGAQSTLGGIVEAAFYTLTTKNNGGENTSIFTLGSVSTPFNAIPEPANWAMLLGGFGLLGFSMRRRGAGRRVTA